MPTRTLFGTDGVRGLANEGWLTPTHLLKLAQAVGAYFIKGNHKHRVVIGKDTRLSGYMVEPALTAGFISMGMDVTLVGPLPTPAIAMLTRSLRADVGVMISASHNPFADNGVKFFDARGLKLPDAVEHQIEQLFHNDWLPVVTGLGLGKAQRLDDAQGRYIEYLKSSFPKDLSLEGLHIVVDCANGAAYKVAPTVLWELGAQVTPLHVTPDGSNINHLCGATHPHDLARAVRELDADIGIALDGDADRVTLVDETGAIIHGDHLLGAIAAAWQATGLLAQPAIVGTVMCNKGLETFLETLNLQLHRVAVGDRYVTQNMAVKGINLGGEPSGHVIMSDYTTTGDGILCALQIMSHLVRTRKKASSLQHLFQLYPQNLVNIPCPRGASSKAILATPSVVQGLKDLEHRYPEAYILVRASGTEPLIRVTIQAPSQSLLDQAQNDVVALIHQVAPQVA